MPAVVALPVLLVSITTCRRNLMRDVLLGAVAVADAVRGYAVEPDAGADRGTGGAVPGWHANAEPAPDRADRCRAWQVR